MSHDSLLLKLVAETKFNEQLCHRKLIIEKYWGIKCFKKTIKTSMEYYEGIRVTTTPEMKNEVN